MNRLFLIGIFAFCCLSKSFAQKKMPHVVGTVIIDSITAMKATEVSVKEWMDFILDNQTDSSLFPDQKKIGFGLSLLFDELKSHQYVYLKVTSSRSSELWGQGLMNVELNKKEYQNLKNIDSNFFSINIPITCISFEQAQKYCKWKEDEFNKYNSNKVVISLPSIDIYKKVIINSDSLCRKKCDSCEGFTFNSLSSICGLPRSNKHYNNGGKGLQRVDSHWPTDLGLYCLQGNAAEMTSTYGIAMGGSFKDFARESYNDRQQLYSKPEDWLGFRFVVTLK